MVSTVVGLGAVALAAPAHAASPERLDVRISPLRPGPVAVDVVRTSLVPDHVKPPAAVRLDTWLPRGARFRLRSVPRCDRVALEHDPASCADARIATGSALIDARPAVPALFDVGVEVYNADPPPGAVAGLLTRILLPTAPMVLPSQIRRATGRAARRFGYVFEERLPAVRPDDPNAPVARRFALHFPRTGAILAPRRCRERVLRFRMRATFADGSTAVATDEVPCRW